MRLLRLALPAVSLALASCITVVAPPSSAGQATARSSAAAPTTAPAQANLPKTFFKGVPLTGGGTDIHLYVDRSMAPVKLNVAFFRAGGMDSIPRNALATGMFREQGDSEEDMQLIYAALGQPGWVEVFTGYAPEGNDMVRWTKLNSFQY